VAEREELIEALCQVVGACATLAAIERLADRILALGRGKAETTKGDEEDGRDHGDERRVGGTPASAGGGADADDPQPRSGLAGGGAPPQRQGHDPAHPKRRKKR